MSTEDVAVRVESDPLDTEAVSFGSPTPRTRFMWWAAGADPSILESIDCPASERRFFAGIGSAVCVTVALAGVAAWMASGMVFLPPEGGFGSMSIIRALGRGAFAIVIMLVLFNLQRFLVGVAGRRSDWDGASARDGFRMTLVLLVSAAVSLAIATPLQVLASEPSVRMRSLAIDQVERMARVPALDAARSAAFADLFAEQARLGSGAGAGRAPQAIGDPLLPGASAAQRLPSPPAPCSESLADCLAALNAAGADPVPTLAAAPGALEAELAALRRTLDAESRDLLRGKLQVADPSNRPEGLIRRAALAYEGNALLCGIVFGVVFLVVSMPLVFRLLADRSPYDLLVRYRNNLLLAEHGIEPEAYEIFDEQGERHLIDEFSAPRHEYQKKAEEILAQRRAWAAERQTAYAARATDIIERR